MRALALLLALLQLAQPAIAADNLAGSLKSLLLESLSQRVASGFEVNNSDPVAERALTPTMLAQARNASEVFSASGSFGVDLYDPADPAKAKTQLARWKAFGARTLNKKTLSDEDIQDAAGALLPFLRYYGQGDARKPDFAGNMVIVPSGKTVQLNLQGYCMDRTAPAPSNGEKLQLVPILNLLPAEAVPLYQAMMQFSAAHVEKRSEIQNLVWGLRHSADPYPPIKELSEAQAGLLDAAMPNGAAIYRSVLARQGQKGQATEARKQLFRQALGAIQTKLNVRLPDPTVSGYTPGDANAIVAALMRMPVEGVPQTHSEYSMLAPGVASRSIANSLNDISVEVRNTTQSAFVFDANQYAGQSTRVTQRVAFGGLLRGNAGNAGNSDASIPQRLHDIFQLLEIGRLKKLQAQIQNTIDQLVDGSGGSKLTLASLALATAVNQVLLPTTALDVAMLPSGGKLLAPTAKIGFREVVAVEKAAAEVDGGYKGVTVGANGGVTVGRGVVYESPSSVVQTRVDNLLSQIPENSQGRITMGVAVVEDANGTRSVLVSTSEPRGYLRPGVTLQPGETVIAGTGHAEDDIVSYANANGLKIIDIGATRPVCGYCQNVIGPTGANVTTPLKPATKAKP